MAKFRYIGEEPRVVALLPAGARRLEPEEMFEVPDSVAEAYECQPQLYDWLDRPDDFVSRDDLVAAARELGLPLEGSKDDIAARITEYAQAKAEAPVPADDTVTPPAPAPKKSAPAKAAAKSKDGD